MPRFKPIHKGLKLLPVDFDRQIQPGSFEHALCYLVDKELDLAPFHARYNNDEIGASAYDPSVLLKIILLACSRGIVSSRKIEAACREMFAIDGVKLPSNASKAKSGTRADFERQAERMEKAAEKMLAKHRDADAAPAGEADKKREDRTLERLQRDAKQMRDWLKCNPEDRKGASGNVRLSNLTDNESAKMATGKGVIQGFTGVAAVDEKHQIVLEAQAHGTGSECLRKPDKTPIRQMAYSFGKADGQVSHTEQMKHHIDSDQGKRMITRCFATVEPVFGNVRDNKRLDRFTPRGR